MSDLTSVDTTALEELLGQIAGEFTERLQHGEQPSIDEYAARYPKLADVLRQVLPALLVMKPNSSAVAAPLDAPAPLATPLELGDFTIVREIGRGGMGVVYEAEQRSLARRVALKVLPFAAALDETRLRRFHHEAQAAALLHHTNIVPVFAVGCEHGVYYYAMQYIEGRTLAGFIAEVSQSACGLAIADQSTGPYEPPSRRHASTALTLPQQPAAWLEPTLAEPSYFHTAARLARQAAEALEHAHQMGVLHRDIKPANLLVDRNGNLWIADFGLARLQNESRLTRSGDVVGTLRYMSPEQILGQHGGMDYRTDIYSLGATLYELLTFQPPFAAENRQELLRQIATVEPIAPRKRNRAVPAELETICLKAMAKEPRDRYATAAEMADDLRRFLEDKPIKARPTSLVHRGARWLRLHRAIVRLCAAGLVLAALGLSAAVVLLWREQQRTNAQRQLAEQEKEIVRRALADEAAQRQRAEDNLDLALEALDQLYLRVVEKRSPPETISRPDDRELLRRALQFYDAFVRRNARDPKVRRQTGKAYWRMAAIHCVLDHEAEAEKALRASLALREAQLAATPQTPDCSSEVAEVLHELARLDYQQKKNLPEARCLLERAIQLQGNALRLRPKNPLYARNLRAYHEQLIRVLLAKDGHAEAARRTEDYVRRFGDDWRTYYAAATLQTACAEAAANDKQLTPEARQNVVRKYEDRAVALLRQAIQHGFTERKSLLRDRRFTRLRQREDFKQLAGDAG